GRFPALAPPPPPPLAPAPRRRAARRCCARADPLPGCGKTREDHHASPRPSRRQPGPPGPPPGPRRPPDRPAGPGQPPLPDPPGGGVDILARLVMPAVAERIPGMRTVVTNRAGAAGQIGLEVIFNAAPDGYTLGATTMPAHSGIPLERPARYRPLDFTFLAN